jgi:hypothetical protein
MKKPAGKFQRVFYFQRANLAARDVRSQGDQNW